MEIESKSVVFVGIEGCIIDWLEIVLSDGNRDGTLTNEESLECIDIKLVETVGIECCNDDV